MRKNALDAEGVRLLIEMLRPGRGRPGLGEWVRRGRCAEVDPELWFPPSHGFSDKAAKEVCAGCEVRAQCLAYAVEADEEFGVWGGLNRAERVRLRDRMQRDGGRRRCWRRRPGSRPRAWTRRGSGWRSPTPRRRVGARKPLW